MRKTSVKKSNTKALQASLSVIFFLLFSNIVYHLLYGDQGYFALKGIEERLELARNKFNNTESQRIDLESRVKMLRPASLNKDMLDERARVVLGLIAPGEIVLLKE